MIYRHIDPTPDRRATAPYNFVPLPERVLSARQALELASDRRPPWEAHDTWLPGTLRGVIDIRAVTETPLFVRSPDGKGEPYLLPDGRAMVPGSGLRGAIRSLMEVLAFAALEHVGEQEAFYRSVGMDRVALEYRDRMVRGDQRPAGGFVRERAGRWVIEPAAGVLRIPHDVIKRDLGGFAYQPSPRHHPSLRNPRLQHATVWVQFEGDRVTAARRGADETPPPDWHAGTLVLTGPAGRKRHEFVLLDPVGAQQVEITSELWERFHDEDQLTYWQKDEFPGGPAGRGSQRSKAGALAEGDPVFYLMEGGSLRFFGRPRMFRLPYDRSAEKLVPEGLRPRDEPDVVQALLGRVDRVPIRSRVRFGHLISEGPARVLERFDALLSSPKSTAYAHYLTQDGSRGRDALTTYLSGDRTAVRGHKLYWTPRGEWVRPPAPKTENRDQVSSIRPVDAGTVLRGHIAFENLYEVELGALLACLDLQASLPTAAGERDRGAAPRHRLGGGKALGLGIVRIEPTLQLIDTAERLASWSGGAPTPAPDEAAQCLRRFVDRVFEHARGSGEPRKKGRQGLRQVRRLDALALLLTPGAAPAGELQSMDLKGFRDKRVLPTPHDVTGQGDDEWRAEDVSRAPAPARRPPGAPGRDHGRGGPSRGTGPPRRDRRDRGPKSGRPERREDSQRPPKRDIGVPTGQQVRSRMLEETTKRGGPKFAVLGTPHVGVLHPTATLPPTAVPGTELEMVVVAGGRIPQLRPVQTCTQAPDR